MIANETKQAAHSLKLWYSRPAAAWTEALPVGNGRLGGMVFGGVAEEVIQLNEDTLWSGIPRDTTNPDAALNLAETRRLVLGGDYRQAQQLVEETMLGPWNESYQPLGNLHLSFLPAGPVTNYRRELDLETAFVSTRYEIDHVEFGREVFISAADQVLVVRLTSSRPGMINCRAKLESLLRHQLSTAHPDSLIMRGYCPVHVEPNYVKSSDPVIYQEPEKGGGMCFEVRLRAISEGGSAQFREGEMIITGADLLTFHLVAATSYHGFQKHPGLNGQEPTAICEEYLTKIDNRDYLSLRRAHLADYQPLFQRVVLDLGGQAETLKPTDERLARLKEGAHGVDPQLIVLLFQYGRYLLIASSRPGTQPANLQGIWNHEIRPPWSSNWTTNINTQMNYWLAEVCNLPECHEPLFQMIAELSVNGTKAAQVNYNCRGWVTNHNVDIWRTPTAVGSSAKWAYWPMAGAWFCSHLWEHYAFTGDRSFLADKAYPIMKQAALFYLDWLIEDQNGHWVTCPSTSPENEFLTPEGEPCSVSMATTMDITQIRELFGHCIEAAGILGRDDPDLDQMKSVLAKLPPFKIGRYGQLQEWFCDFEEVEPGHRHVSHLYGLHPGNLIQLRRDPELAAACRKSLDRRLANGGGHTGWRCAWLINLFARLEDGETACHYLNHLLDKSVYSNLFDLHPPLTDDDDTVFQIDGNFGATAGIAEMLLQSHAGEIRLLPALPKAWPLGYVNGLCARGGYEVDIRWENCRLSQVEIRAKHGGVCTVAYHDRITMIQMNSGESITLDPNLHYQKEKS